MSQSEPQQAVVVEWSPSYVYAYDPLTRASRQGDTFADILPFFSHGRPVVVAVSRRSSFVKTIRVPNASARDIEMVLATQMATMFPVPLTELSHTFKLTSDINESGRLAVVAAMRATDLRQISEDAKTLGIRIARVVPAAFGSVLLTESVGLADSAVAQETPEGLVIDIVAGGELRYSRATTMPAAAAIIDAEVSRTFAAASLPCAPTVAAGGLQLPEAERITSHNSLELLGAGSERLGISLQLTELIELAAKKRVNQRIRLASFVLIASILSATYVLTERADAAAAVHKGESKWSAQLTKLRKQRDLEQAKAATALKFQSVVARAFEPAQRLEDVVAVVTNAMPPGMWLTGLTVERGKPLIFRGVATKNETVAQFQATLSNQDRLRDLKLVFTNNSDIEKTPVVQFSMSAFPVGNLPLLDAKKKGATK